MENKRISFLEKENLAYVTTEENRLIIEKNKTNLKDILVTKNTIDFIFNKINSINVKNRNLNWFQVTKIPLISLIISIIFAIPMFFINVIPILIVLGIVTLKFLVMSVITLKDWIKIKNNMNSSSKMQIDFLEKESEYELEQLKKLENISRDKKVETIKSITIPKSEKIEILKNKLCLIQHYNNNKLEYLKLYNSNSLNNLIDISNYTESDVEFIKYIIEEDLKNKENEKVKIKCKIK